MSRRGFDWEGLADFDLWLRLVLIGAVAAAMLVGMATEAFGGDPWVPGWATFVVVVLVALVVRYVRHRRAGRNWSEDSWR
jgi:ABC-type Mn2+/Zn2+ transport system permease subunit